MANASDNVINNVATVTDEASAKLQAIGKAGEAMGEKMAAASETATVGLRRMEQAAARAQQGRGGSGSGTLSITGADLQNVVKLQDELIARARTLNEYVNKAAGTSFPQLKASIESAFDTKSLDRLGEKILLLEARSEAASKVGMGKGRLPLLESINKANTVGEIDKIITEMQRLQAESEKTGEKGKHGFDKVKEGAHAAMQQVEKMIAGMGPLGQSMVAFGLVETIFNAVEGAIEAVSEAWEKFFEGLKEKATELRSLRIETFSTGLSIQQLETMQFAEKKLGIESGNLMFAMRQLNDTIFTHGSALHNLGIETKDTHGNFRKTGEVMADLMDVFKNSENQTERMRLATELFGGRMGTRLIPLLMLGKKGFEELEHQADDLGFALDVHGQDALINYANATALADAKWEGLQNRLRATVAPMLTWFADISSATASMFNLDAFDRWVQKTNGKSGHGGHESGGHAAGEEWWKGFFKAGDAASMMSAHAETPISKFLAEMGGGSTGAAKKELDEMLKLMGSLEKSTGAYAGSIDKLAVGFSGTFNEVLRLRRELKLTDAQVQQVASRAPIARALASAFGDAWRSVEKFASAAIGQFEAIPQKVQAARDAINKSFTFVDPSDAADRTDRLTTLADSLMRAGTEPMRVFNILMAQTKGNMEEVGTILDAAKTRAKEANDAILDMEKRHASDRAVSRQEQLDQQRFDKLKDMKKNAQEAGDLFSGIGEGLVNVFSKMEEGMNQFFGRFLDRVFATKSAWGFVWRAMTEEALRVLNKIIMSKLFLFVVQLVTKMKFPSGGPMDSLLPGPIETGGMAMTAGGGTSSAIGVTNNYVTVQSFSPRDVVRDFTSPEGSMRAARNRLAFMAER